MNKDEILALVRNKKMSPKEAAAAYNQLLKEKNKKSMEITQQLVHSNEQNQSCEIAIIGISGQFPKAKNLDEYWDNLKNGRDCVSEITRWDMSAIYDEHPGKQHKTYCKDGGFLDDIDEFDPQFFDLSPKQAEFMEPRQRMFMEEAWNVIEDAGYSGQALSGTKCGVFVGCEGTTYYFDHISKDNFNPNIFLGESNSALAARISYYLDLKGPSVTIDTACSSSLVAIHLACESIKSGDCQTAIAGGVTIMSLPEGYVLLSSMNMLSKEGRCKTFDESADGFVPGEGVGVVLLKPLSQAVKDRDHIYGIIKGTGINQDGKTNGLTAPSAVSQTTLEKEVYERYGINPETISYVEAHGTGTQLGDTIEFDALKKAFESYTDKKNFCAIGSVKTNIGHASAAAGVSGVLKVLLAMKNGQLPPSLHLHNCNKLIHFEESPFYALQQLQPWEGKNGIRRSAVSSFGHSGTNCHMVIDDAIRYNQEGKGSLTKPYYFVPVSAKTKDALQKKWIDLSHWLKSSGADKNLEDILFTLQEGRNHFKVRSVVIVDSMEDLKRKASRIAEGHKETAYLETGADGVEDKEVLSEQIWNTISSDNSNGYYESLMKLAQHYVSGGGIDFHRLSSLTKGCRISMPTYPFAKEKYWVKEEEEIPKTNVVNTLLDENCSTFKEQSYYKTFMGTEFFIQDHNSVVPAVIYLEMIRQAGEASNGSRQVRSIENVILLTPVIVHGEPVKTKISLYPKKQYVEFEITTQSERDSLQKHVQGRLSFEEQRMSVRKIDIEKEQAECIGGRNEAVSYYEKVAELGGSLGRRFQGLKEFYYNQEKAIIKMEAEPDIENLVKEFGIHPVLTDAGIQACVAFSYKLGADPDILYLPFMVEKMSIFDTSKRCSYALLRRSGQKEQGEQYYFDILYLAEDGTILVEVKNLIIRKVQKDMLKIAQSGSENLENYYFKKEWMEEDSDLKKEESPFPENLIIFKDGQELFHIPNNIDVITVVKGSKFEKLDENTYSVNPNMEKDYQLFIDELNEMKWHMDNILYLWNSNQSFDVNDDAHVVLEPVFYLTKTLCLNHVGKNLLFLNEGFNPFYDGLEGYFKCLEIENPNLAVSLVSIESRQCNLWNSNEMKCLVSREFSQGCKNNSLHVLYKDHTRFIKSVKQYVPEYSQDAEGFKENGCYVITGGMGSLGIMFAEYISREFHGKLVLLGRSSLTDKMQEKLKKLEKLGGNACYIQANIADREAAVNAVERAKKIYGRIDGVIHCAAVTRDSMITKKKYADVRQVLEPKLRGIMNLDYCLKEEGLDLMILFSSTTGVIGNVGQADYGYANAFLDSYAQWCKTNRFYKHCIAAIWPLWENGGLTVDNNMKRLIYTTSGMMPLADDNGLEAFKLAVKEKDSHLIVVTGDLEKIKKSFGIGEKHIQKETSQKEVQPGIDMGKLNDLFINEFIKISGLVTSLPTDKVDLSKSLDELGFDSISFTELANRLNEKFHLDITPAIFFGQPTLMAIAETLISEYKEKLFSQIQADEEPLKTEEPVKVQEEAGIRSRFAEWEECNYAVQKAEEDEEPIAIIGMDCTMPLSDNKEEYWEKMFQNVEMLTTVPKERWDWKDFYGEASMEDCKTKIKTAGFMNEVDKFDPLFFHISTREAILMDPQERLIIESVWKTIEDAGYKASELAGSKTGVYIGVTNSDYKELLIRNNILTVLTQSMIANRVSYLYDFIGPSEPVDTACSSSLVALHKAVKSLREGETELAIVGGVNVLVSPYMFVYQNIAGMLSPSEKCNSFDEAADGYVRGEGVGTVLLKPYSKAVKDGDHVYALIRGTALNHGGHGNSLTAPNPNAQADVILKAYENAKISPYSVQYIEAHGTGTKLGDPIEIEGLKKAFSQYADEHGMKEIKENSIGVGTVKASIGHLESAAGISALIKTVLSMNHKKMLGIHGLKKQNPYIKLEESPFYLVKDTKDWEDNMDQYGNVIPRRAGISSFGIGGVNVHAVLEEADAGKQRKKKNQNSKEVVKRLIVLSAKEEEVLEKKIQQLKDFIITNKLTDLDVTAESKDLSEVEETVLQSISDILMLDRKEIDRSDSFDMLGFDYISLSHFEQRLRMKYGTLLLNQHIGMDCSVKKLLSDIRLNLPVGYEESPEYSFQNFAYTLQTGREEMEERAAFIADSYSSLLNLLEDYLEKKYENMNIITSKTVTNEGFKTPEGTIYKTAIDWVNKRKISWSEFYEGKECRRISLPSYPFAKEHVWFDMLVKKESKPEKKPLPESKSQLEPEQKKEDVTGGDIISFLASLDEESF